MRGAKMIARIITLIAMPIAVTYIFVIDLWHSGLQNAITNAGLNVSESLRWAITGRGEVGGEEW